MSFPLYDVLVKDVPDKELTKEEKIKLISIIPTLDQKGHDNMYTLIRVHGLKNNVGGNVFDIPYEGEKINKTNDKTLKDLNFNIDKLPHIVSQMIYKFAIIHTNTMKEDKSLLRSN